MSVKHANRAREYRHGHLCGEQTISVWLGTTKKRRHHVLPLQLQDDCKVCTSISCLSICVHCLMLAFGNTVTL